MLQPQLTAPTFLDSFFIRHHIYCNYT